MKIMLADKVVLKCDGSPDRMDCKNRIEILRHDLIGKDFEDYIFTKFGWVVKEIAFSDHLCGECSENWHDISVGGSAS
ncbi:MAG: hypothetical protein PVG39_07865 [Desulfobacteraceae bacterium]|jgi:hypothetical protein